MLPLDFYRRGARLSPAPLDPVLVPEDDASLTPIGPHALSPALEPPIAMPQLRPDLGPGAYEANGRVSQPGKLRNILGAAAAGFVGGTLGPQAGEETATRMLYTPYQMESEKAGQAEAARRQRNKELMDVAKEQRESEKANADIAESAAKTKLYGAQAEAKGEPAKPEMLKTNQGWLLWDPSNRTFKPLTDATGKPYLPDDATKPVIHELDDGSLVSVDLGSGKAIPITGLGGKPVKGKGKEKVPGRDIPLPPEVEAQRIRISKQSGAVDLSDDATEMMAQQYARTGQLPSVGFGKAGTEMRGKIANRAAEIYKNLNLADQQAAFSANRNSLTTAQKTLDAVTAFENTAGKNLDMFLGTAKKIVDSGSPWINTPLRAVSQQGMGSADLAAFNAARQVALTEIAKVTNNPNLTGQLSDTARKEIEAIMGPNATLAQIYSVANTLKQDMANRKKALQEQVSAIRDRVASAPRSSNPAGSVAPGNMKAKSDDELLKILGGK